MFKLLIGLVFSLLAAFSAMKKGSLSFSGFCGAVILGTSLYYFGGLYLSGIMICFFISSSLLTRFGDKEKAVLEDINEKTGGRDYAQVIANGGLGLIYSALYFLTGSHLYLIAYAVSFASANSDTWSSEVGVLSRKPPVSILSFRRAERGISGAVSLLGTFAAFCGSFFISTAFFIGYLLFLGWNDKLIYYWLLIGVAGFLGSITDSYLGALVQAKFRCPVCGKATEKRRHHGRNTIHISGIRIIGNDAVNFLSSLIVSLAAMLFI